jgi:hypothetical protein
MAAGLPTYWTNPAAEGWGGDRFYELRPPPASNVATSSVWITLWDTAQDRDEFETAYQSTLVKPVEVLPIGARGAAFLFGFTQSSALAMRLSELRFTRAGKPWDPKSPN